ncbi:MAG: hypothetical protein INQ03_00275 [Candidatus Heimdallarchaeota archaeon]|nr:hypothetical protein [Candidatus Heimdallarchaeota archaeon]
MTILLSTNKFDTAILNFLKISKQAVKHPITECQDGQFSHLILSEKEHKIGTIKQMLNKQRSKYHIVSMNAVSAKYLAYAAVEDRIDAIWLDHRVNLRLFNLRYARRLEESKKLIFLDLSIFFDSYKASKIRNLVRIINVIDKTSLAFILTKQVSSSDDLRSYRGLQSLATILGLSRKQTNPQSLLNRINENTARLNGTIPARGVRLEEN